MGNLAGRRVFVGGCQRSGTTMTGHLVADATRLLLLPECPILREAIRHGGGTDSTVRSTHFLDHWRIKLWGNEFACRRNELDRTNTPEDLFESMTRLYGEVRNETDRYTNGWVEHSPHNFECFTDMTRRFTNARFLHVIRDPRAVAASYLRVDFGPTSVIQAAMTWKAAIMDGLLAESLYPESVCRVSYEDVVSDPVTTMRDVSRKLGLQFDEDWQPAGRNADQALEGHQKLITRAPVTDRTAAWKKELSQNQIADIEYIAGNAMELLGYELTPGAASSSKRSRRYLNNAIDGVKQVIWQLPKRHISRRLNLWRR